MILHLILASAPFGAVNPGVCATLVREPEMLVTMLQQETCPLVAPANPNYDVVCPEGYHKDWPCYMAAVSVWDTCVQELRDYYCGLWEVVRDEHNACLRDAYNAFQACLATHPGDPTGSCASAYYSAVQACDQHYYEEDLPLLRDMLDASIAASCDPEFIHAISTCCTKD